MEFLNHSLPSVRHKKLSNQLRKSLPPILDKILRQANLPRLLITQVMVQERCLFARIYFLAPCGEQWDAELINKILTCCQAQQGTMRGLLGRQLHLKRIPELFFHWDEQYQAAEKVYQLLHQHDKDDGPYDQL